MKKVIFLLVMIGVMGYAIPNIKAQTWAQPGATWYYDYTNSWTDYGYHEIQNTGDTLFNGFLCDKLLSTFHGYDYFAGQFFTFQSMDYTYISNDTLYHFYNDRFNVMAIFTAQAGDTLKIPTDTTICFALDTDYYVVDSIGQGIYSGDTLATIYYPNYQMFLTRKMGFSLFMFSDPNCIIDQDNDFGLRCYSDSSGFYYNSGIVNQCDSTVGIENIYTLDNSIQIYPNPTSGFITFKGDLRFSNYYLRLTNVLGREVYHQAIINQQSSVINISQISNGVYFYQLTNGKETYRGKFVKN